MYSEDLLKIIVPVLEVGYKKLTTDKPANNESLFALTYSWVLKICLPLCRGITEDAGRRRDRWLVDDEVKFIDVLEEDELEEKVSL